MSRSEQDELTDQLIAAFQSDALSDANLQRLFEASVRLFAERFEEGRIAAPFPDDNGVVATEASIACSAVLRAVNIETFELGLWQSWQGQH